jgi:hypothetical protein
VEHHEMSEQDSRDTDATDLVQLGSEIAGGAVGAAIGLFGGPVGAKDDFDIANMDSSLFTFFTNTYRRENISTTALASEIYDLYQSNVLLQDIGPVTITVHHVIGELTETGFALYELMELEDIEQSELDEIFSLLSNMKNLYN